ncbi:MAG: polysaccharide biosynthesis tyrosine autokinase [Bacteroidaceae bacterium]|nr:polysaccharide biosynthesis tyrosine autokinase [Bacteroidaceae bacterium]
MKDRENFQDEELEIDLLDLLKDIVEKKKFIAKCTAACLIVAGAYCLIAKPVFESESVLRVKPSRGIAESMLENGMLGNVQLAQQQMMTYAEIIKSRSVVENTIKDVLGAQGEKLPEWDAFAKKNIKTSPVKNTELFKVTASGKSPEEAQKLNSRLVANFLSALVDISNSQQKQAKELLQKRAQDAKDELARAEKAMQEFQTEHKLLDPGTSVKILSERIAMVEKGANAARLDVENLNNRLAVVNGQLNNEGIRFAENSMVEKIRNQIEDLEVSRIALMNKYTEEHPKIVEINKRIGDLQNQMSQETQRVVALEVPSTNTVHAGMVKDKIDTEAKLAIAHRKLATLEKVRAENEEKLKTLPDLERKFALVKRDVDNAKNLHALFTKRFEESKAAEIATVGDVQIVDSASLPTKKSAPKRGMILAISVLLGALLSSGWVALKSILKPRLKNEAGVERFLHLPTLGAIKDFAEGTDIKAYSTLRSNIAFLAMDKGIKSFVLTSAVAGEGKTRTAKALAELLGETGSKVLLMDCNLLNPAKPMATSWQGDYANLVNYIEAGSQVDELHSAKASDGATGTFLNKDFAQAFKNLEEEYDYILLDASSVADAADTLDLCRLAGGTLLVAEAGSEAGQVKEAREKLAQVGANVLGIVLNKC